MTTPDPLRTLYANAAHDMGIEDGEVVLLSEATVRAALAAQPAPQPPLDVERLAEALALTEVGCWATGARHTPEQDNQQHGRDAEAIAAAYAALEEKP